jgi:hypothetical protein
MIYISIFLLLLSGISEAIMDKLQFHYSLSIFSKYNPLFWDPSISWKNKWKDGWKENGERFWLSSTLLVFTTDGWHLFKFFRNLFIFSAIFFLLLPYNTLLISLLITSILRLTYGISFYTNYNYLLKNK